MKSFVLSRGGRYLFPWILILSLVVLYRGHNLPGGGFIGGLMAALAFILVGLGDSMQAARERLKVSPVRLMGVGLLIAVLSGAPALFVGEAFMTGKWLPGFSLPILGKVHLGTPLVFDIGVYFTVVGFALHTTMSLAALGHAEGEEGNLD